MSLVETDWLKKNISSVKIIDCSWHMPQTKRNGLEEYKNQHIPNSIFFDLDANSKKLTKFLTRHHVKPGFTGLAQIRSRVKTDSLALMNEKLESDLEYIKNCSLLLDIKILLNTPISMWKNKKSNT